MTDAIIANPAMEALERQRDRAIAVVLNVKERECDPHLPPEARQRMRKAILDQINGLHAFMVQILRSMDRDDVVFNNLYFDLLDDLHRTLIQHRRL